MVQIQVQNFGIGAVEIFSCNAAGCCALVGLRADVYRRVRESGETFYCSAGHARHFPPGPSAAEVRFQAELAAERRLRELAERRLGTSEAELLKASRERDDARRTLKRGLKVAGAVVAGEKAARGAKSRKGA